jgi:hypothetical protein
MKPRQYGLDSYLAMIPICLDCPLDLVVFGVCIHLQVHDIANSVQLLNDEVQDWYSGKHGNVFQSIVLKKLNQANESEAYRMLLTLLWIELGITCPRIGSTPPRAKDKPVNTQLLPSRRNAYTAFSP